MARVVDMAAPKATVAALLKGIERYNPQNLATLEHYVELQVKENEYDLEANLAVLKLYQFNPNFFQALVTAQILLKALTNLPHSDFTLCKCLIESSRLEQPPLDKVIQMAHLLEICDFPQFWAFTAENRELTFGLTGFEDSIRKFVCHVVNITYQTIKYETLQELLGMLPDEGVDMWINKYGWKKQPDRTVFIINQEELIKPKSITEKITFDSVAGIMIGQASIPAFR